MITIKNKHPYLGIPFSQVLNVDIIQNLKEGFGMMGMRFTGKPNKARIVKMYDKYVKENPADVLRCLRPGELTLIDRFIDALYEYEEVLDEYKGKLTSLIAATPQGFAGKQKDIDTVMKNFRYVYDNIIDMQAKLEEVREMETSDEYEEEIDPEDKEQLEKLFNSKTVKDTIEQIKKDRMDAMAEAERAQREDGPFKYLPAFTKHPAKYPPLKESYCGTRLVRPRIFEITLPLKDGLYFIVYFIYLEQKGYTQATCYWGNIFDFAQKAAAEPYPGAGYVTLSKPFRKKYPHVAAVYGMHEDNEDCTKPYLTTIGWDGQPKEWFLSVRLWDFDYTRLITLSPLDCQEAIDAIDALRDASLAMMQDIQRSDAKQPKQLMKELFSISNQ